MFSAAVRRIQSLPGGAEKAEYWLLPIARETGANADMEAAAHFAVRGRYEVTDTAE